MKGKRRKVVLVCGCGHGTPVELTAGHVFGLPPGSFELSMGFYSVTCPVCKHQGQAKLHEPREVHTRPVSGPGRK